MKTDVQKTLEDALEVQWGKVKNLKEVFAKVLDEKDARIAELEAEVVRLKNEKGYTEQMRVETAEKRREGYQGEG